MKRIFKALTMVLAILGAISLDTSVAAQDHNDNHPSAAHHNPFAHHVDTPHHEVAIADMHAYAARHHNPGTEIPHTYGTAEQWDHEWELRWIDYVTSTGVVRIYHAINKHNDGVRYTSSWEGNQPHYHAWEPIH